MKVEELISICDAKNTSKGNSFWIYWSSELYGFGKIIRNYSYYPCSFPLAIYTDHSSPDFIESTYLHKKDANAPYFLTHRKLKTENYIKETNKKVTYVPSS